MRSLIDRIRDYYAFGGDAVLPAVTDAMPPKGIEITWKGWGLWHGDSLLATLAWERPPRRVLEGNYSTTRIRFESKTYTSSRVFDTSNNCDVGTIDLLPNPNRKQGISDFSQIFMSSRQAYRLQDAGAWTFYFVDEGDRLLGITKLKNEMTFRLMVDPSESKVDPRLIAILSRYCINARYSDSSFAA